MSELFAASELFNPTKLSISLGVLGAATGFWAGTKLRHVDTGFPGIFAVAGAVLCYLLASYLVAVGLTVLAILVLVLLIKSWPTVAKVLTTLGQKFASMFPTTFRRRSMHKHLAAEQRRMDSELEQVRTLNIDPSVKKRLLEKLTNDHRDRLLKLADRSGTKRP